MKVRHCSQISWITLCTFVLLLSACSGGGGSNSGAGGSATAAPTADAGPDQRVVFGTVTVNLDGSRSSDPDGDTLQYAWSFVQRPAGSSAALSDANTPASRFTPDLAGMYRVELAVSDGQYSAVDIVDVDVAANTSPVADAGPDQHMNRGETVTLDGSASRDPDGQPLTYTWTQVANDCPDVTSGAGTLTGARPTFVAPTDICTVAFDLRVNDGLGDSFADRVVVLVLEDKNNALFVNGASGNDGNPGTRASPMRTIQAAIGAAAPTGADLYITAGTFSVRTFTLATGVSLYGGYDLDWQRFVMRGYRSSMLSSDTRAVSGTDVSGLTLDGLSINSADALASGESAYALVLVNATGITLTRNDFNAGHGADGVDGTRGSDGTYNASMDGGAGGSGSCDGAARGVGGAGGAASGTTGANTGGTGGMGGPEGANNGDGGLTGQAPFGSFTPGGAGGTGGNPGLPGSNGWDGANGSAGRSGTPGTGVGTFTGAGYLATNSGGAGTPGLSGAGGGGGGGGGGQGGNFVNDGSGNGGGGGGTGGVGGSGGTGGSSGGGSFGIYLVNATSVTLQDNVINTAGGGSGGDGGPGGIGGPGGRGGPGGSWCTSEIGAGGNGGNGGRGGGGGQGGGGAGGPSVGIAAGNGTQFAVPLADNVINVGAPAAGGAPNGGVGIAVPMHNF